MDKQSAQQLVAELIEVNEQAFALLANAMADITGRSALADALERRLASAQGAGGHPMALAMLARTLRGLKAN
jgi:hypothetical protein